MTQLTVQPGRSMLIGGEFRKAASGRTIDAVNPATGETIATIPAGNRDDIDQAVRAAERAFRDWAADRAHRACRLGGQAGHRRRGAR